MVVYICAARYHNLLPNPNLNYPTVEIPNPPIFYHAAVQYTKHLNHMYQSMIFFQIASTKQPGMQILYYNLIMNKNSSKIAYEMF